MNYKLSRPEAKTPIQGSEYAAGYDLTACEVKIEGDIVKYYTGVHVEIPHGYAGFLFPRSSVYKKDLELANSVGVIDSDYRGEIIAVFRINYSARHPVSEKALHELQIYKPGDRIAQLVILPIHTPTLVEEENLSITDRNTGGFGSTGN